MPFIDYYQILGVAKDASPDDIRKAYRKLARQHHPDLNPNDDAAKQKFQQINEANEVLSDADKRKKYDQYGEQWQHADQIEAQRRQQGSRQGGFGGQQHSGQGFDSGGFDYSGAGGGEGFSDFFESMFGNRGGSRSAGSGRTFRGQDVQATLQVSLRDAAATHKQTFTIGGKQVRITIPAGAYDGQQIRLKGYGNPGPGGGGEAGDLYITFQIGEDLQFRREGNDLYTTATIDLYTAVLGGEANIPTLGSQVKLKVKPGAQPGDKVRLKGKGFPVHKAEGQHGDLFVTYQVSIPKNLTDEQRALFEKLSGRVS